MPAIPAGFGWSTDQHEGDNPHVSWDEGAAYTGQRAGSGR